MVDFDAAVAAVQDPNADPVFLAKIAYENPEFGANVVANPRAYPGLKRWVAEFGDERARQQLVAMGWTVPQNGVQPHLIAEPTAQPMAEPVAEQVQPEQQYQPAVAEQFQQEQQYQPEQPVNQQYGQDAAYAASNEASTEYVDPYMNPADLSEVADYSSSQPQNEPEQQYAEQQYAAAQESPADAGFTAELAMTTTDQMLMARIASEAPELRPCLARNPYIYPELLAWLGQLNDSAINAAIRLRQQ
ncbi:protein [Bifidobacterium adolescentis]|nr:protein [Bifidobacterium adolescentis]